MLFVMLTWHADPGAQLQDRFLKIRPHFLPLTLRLKMLLLRLAGAGEPVIVDCGIL